MRNNQLWAVIAGLILINCLTIAFFLFKTSEVGGAAMKGEEVATIGGNSISRQEWLNELESRYGKDVLKDMIDQKVIESMASKYKIKISDQEVNREFRMMQASNNSFSLKTTADEKKWKDQIRSSLELEELLTKDATFSKKELKNYYADNRSLFTLPEAYHLAHIVVKTKEEATKSIEELKNGSSFEALAIERSIDEFSANEGGDIGYISEESEQYPEDYVQTAQDLKKGEISAPIKVDEGYAIVKLLSKLSGEDYSFNEVKDQIRRQLALEQMDTPASASTLWKEAKVKWFYGHDKETD